MTIKITVKFQIEGGVCPSRFLPPMNLRSSRIDYHYYILMHCILLLFHTLILLIYLILFILSILVNIINATTLCFIKEPFKKYYLLIYLLFLSTYLYT